jgi:hypothetical protein
VSELDQFVEWAMDREWTRAARWADDVVLTDDGVSLNEDGPDFVTVPLPQLVLAFREDRS